MRLIPSCREASELLSLAQDRRLTVREKLILHIHLPLCRGCRNFKAQLGFIRRAVRAYLQR